MLFLEYRTRKSEILIRKLVPIIIFGHGRIHIVRVEHLDELLIAIDRSRDSDLDLRQIDFPDTVSLFRYNQGPQRTIKTEDIGPPGSLSSGVRSELAMFGMDASVDSYKFPREDLVRMETVYALRL